MTEALFDKQKFCSDFSEYYYNSNIYNVANAFMVYFETQIFNTPKYDIWFDHFFPEIEKDNRILYCKLLKIVQKNVMEKYMIE